MHGEKCQKEVTLLCKKCNGGVYRPFFSLSPSHIGSLAARAPYRYCSCVTVAYPISSSSVANSASNSLISGEVGKRWHAACKCLPTSCKFLQTPDINIAEIVQEHGAPGLKVCSSRHFQN